MRKLGIFLAYFEETVFASYPGWALKATTKTQQILELLLVEAYFR